MKRTTLNCPRCAGSFDVREGDRVTRCHNCGVKLFVDLGEHIPRYCFKPKIGIKQAKATVRKAISSHGVTSSVHGPTSWRGAKLCYVPFYEMTGRRLGSFTSFEKKVKFTPLNKVEQMERDTRIVMGDVMRSVPAMELDGWGLEHISVEKARQTEHIHAFDRKKFGSHTMVFNPEISFDEVVASIFKVMEISAGGDETEIEEKEALVIYYPVYWARYSYKKRLYQATVDALSGEIMEAHAPHLGGGRVNMLLISLALIAFPISKLIKLMVVESIKNGPSGVMAAAVGISIHPVGMSLIILFMVLALMMLTFGWKHFRYAGELIIGPDRAEVEYISQPGATWMDKALNGLLKAIDRAWQAGRRR